MELYIIVWTIAGILLALGLLGRNEKYKELTEKIFRILGLAVVTTGLGYVGWQIIKVFL